MTLEELLDEYYNTFGENYPLVKTMTTADEAIAEIIARIESGTPAEQPEYEPDTDY